MDSTTSRLPFPEPMFSCDLRWDFALEMGLLDLLRQPRPAPFFIQRNRLRADNPDADDLVKLMNAARLTTHVPRWTLAGSVWLAEKPKPNWWLSNGDEWLIVSPEGLWADMLRRIVRQGLPMARLVADRQPKTGGRAVYAEVALLHDANRGRLTAHRTSRALDFVRRCGRTRIEHR